RIIAVGEPVSVQAVHRKTHHGDTAARRRRKIRGRYRSSRHRRKETLPSNRIAWFSPCLSAPVVGSLQEASLPNILAELISQLNIGALRVIDLTQPLSPQTPLLPLPTQWSNTP